jgi:glycosyltransferase involved in cell wall biosynthesis
MKRVIHVLRQMNPGGIECWLDRLIRNWPERDRPEFHLVLETEDFGVLAPGLADLGVRFHYCPSPARTFSMWTRFKELLRKLQPVDAIHCHNHRAALFHLLVAASEKVPIRIAHSHADFRVRDNASGVARRGYGAISKLAIDWACNRRIAVSGAAAKDLFGRMSNGISIAPCGTDFRPLLRMERRSDPSSFNLVHVGRLVPEKNHEFLLHLLKALVRVEPKARLRLIGDGPLRPQLEELAKSLSLQRHVEFLGNRLDIPDLLAAADVFVFPSLSEGLGLAAIEAQAAGLPVVIASHLPGELDLIPGLHRRLALELPMEAWVSTLLEIRSLPAVPGAVRQACVGSSPFSIHSNVHFLEQLYAG